MSGADTMPDPAAALAQLAAATRYSSLPAGSLQRAKDFLLDTLGVGVAGSGLPLIGELLQAARGWGEGGGQGGGQGGQASILGRADRLPAAAAAIVNAYQFHGLEYDCVHETAVLHPMACLLGAVLAFAEREGAISGRRLLSAICLGVEAASRVGLAATTGLRFFRPATAGGFGAALALGHLAGMDAPGIVNVLGLQLGQASGTMQAHVEGSPLLGLQVGFNARAALCAVDLARAGFAGPRQVLAGPFGYLPLFEQGFDLDRGFASLGSDWQIDHLAYKPFPSGRATHGIVDAIQTWQRERPFAPDAVERIDAFLPPLTWRLVGRPAIADPAPSYARLCLQYVAAVALRRGSIDVPDYAPARMSDPATLALARRIVAHVDDNPDPNALSPQRFELRLTDGSVRRLDLPHSLGHPARTLSRAQVVDKFRRNWAYGASVLPSGNADRLIALIDRLEDCEDVSALATLTRPA